MNKKRVAKSALASVNDAASKLCYIRLGYAPEAGKKWVRRLWATTVSPKKQVAGRKH
jgi:hypothetical protein